MSRAYAEQKIKQALKETEGSQRKALQKVIGWAMQDARLMQELAGPHMTGITAHAIQRVVDKQNRQDIEIQIPEEAVPLDMEPSEFGKQMLGALSGGHVQFGDEVYGGGSASKKTQASKSHMDAIQRLTQGRVHKKLK